MSENEGELSKYEPGSANPPPFRPAPIKPPASPAPVPASAHSHQLERFPVIAVVLLHFCTCGLFTLIWLNLMHGRLPKVREDDPSAGKAIGFCFIPFFNLYWIFFTFRRLCLRIDEQRNLYGMPASNLTGMATAACIVQVIPYVNLLGYLITLPLFAGLVQSSVNGLVDTSAKTAPQKTLQAVPASGGKMPVWGIVLLVCAPLLLIFVIAVLAGLLLPALSAARVKAERIKCASNLKQVGLAFRIWEGDHGDQFPFNVSATNGGTFEFCEPGSDGFDRNSWRHFQVVSNELGSVPALVCPADRGKQAAADFADLQPFNVSYLVHSGTNMDDAHPQEVLAICPVHGNVLFCDGSIRQLTRLQMQKLMESIAKER